MDLAWGHTFFALQFTHAILGKIIKKRKRSNPITKSRMISTMTEKFKTRAGIMAKIGIIKLAIYRLLGQNIPLARFGKSLTFPSFATFLDIRFKPDMHKELSSL
jgi:hypothetical protein